jgi:hypothetical protein
MVTIGYSYPLLKVVWLENCLLPEIPAYGTVVDSEIMYDAYIFR